MRNPYRWNREGQPSGEELARINADITKTMQDVVRYDRRNPNQLENTSKVGVSGAAQVSEGVALDVGRGSGWQKEIPIAPPAGLGVIDAMIDAALPPPKVDAIAMLEKASPAQLDEVLALARQRPDSEQMRKIIAMLEERKAEGSATD